MCTGSQRKCRGVMVWGSSRKACWNRAYLPWVPKDEEYSPDGFTGLGQDGYEEALRCQTAQQIQEAQYTGFLELKEFSGVKGEVTPGDAAVNMDQFSSVAQLCLTLCNPMDCSTPGFPVHHQLLEPIQTHVHCIGDAIQPSYPLSSPSPPTFNLSQHQGLFQWVDSSHQVAKGLEFQLSISPSNEYSGLISFKIGWLDLLGKMDGAQQTNIFLMV